MAIDVCSRCVTTEMVNGVSRDGGRKDLYNMLVSMTDHPRSSPSTEPFDTKLLFTYHPKLIPMLMRL